MINIKSLYDSVKAQSNTETTGWVDDNDFNNFLRLSETALLEFLTGKVNEPPAPFLRKNEDWLLPFSKRKHGNMRASVIPYPGDYFHHIGVNVKSLSEKWNGLDVLTAPQAQNNRSSDIPEAQKALSAATQDNGLRIFAENVSTEYELLYYRYPVFGLYVSKLDTVYNEKVYDPEKSKDLEWPQIAEPYFVWKINDYINRRNREMVAAQMNQP